MNQLITINKLSTQLGLTSRTLRHWESENLFNSIRDQESGWRVFNEEAVVRIKITSVLRILDIPLKDIKKILETKTTSIVANIINEQLHLIDHDVMELITRKNLLNGLMNSLVKISKIGASSSLIELENFLNTELQSYKNEKMEDIIMINNENPNRQLRFITLPSIRTVYNIAVSSAPEDEAMAPILEWLESSNLMSTAKLYGGNVSPFPNKDSNQYGYGMCASIPENVQIPNYLKEMRLPGGLYATMPSTDDIYGSWQLLMKYISQNNEYIPDRTRLCLEEHIRNDNPKGQGSQFILNLLEPVKKK